MSKYFLVLGFMILAIASLKPVSAADMLTLTKTGNGPAIVDAASFEKAWGSATPACIKDGGKLLKVNAAYAKMGLKSNACSNTEKALIKQRLLGYSIVKFDLTSLPEKYARQAMGLN